MIHSVLNHENRFYFGCFQLNTLDLNDDPTTTGTSSEKSSPAKNYWFHSPAVEEMFYKEPPRVRNPVFPHHREIGEGDLFKLVGYNEQVVHTMFGLYAQFSRAAAATTTGSTTSVKAEQKTD